MAEKDKKSGLKKFFQENRSLVVTIPVFVVLVIVAILVIVLNGNGKVAETTPAETNPTVTEQPVNSTPVPTASGGTEVTTLPKDERDKDQSEILRNPLASPYKVSGIIYDEKGGSLAIIEAENKSFIVEAGDTAGGYFKVLEIRAGEVVLDVEGVEIVLSMPGN